MTTKRKPRLTTNTPQLLDTTIARIRAAARQFVRAGGSMFPSSNPSDVDEHIGNVVIDLKGTAREEFEQALEGTTFAQRDDYARISNASDRVVSETSDAAFLFGAFVGLELAALAFVGQATYVGQVPVVDTKKSYEWQCDEPSVTKKGGAL